MRRDQGGSMHCADSSGGFLPAGGNYRKLKSFRKAEIISDLTYDFCARFLARGDRTVDQMVQAARSGKQDIIEGSKAARASRITELKLTNVARASLEELPGDYEDALRVRRAAVWEKNSPEAKFVRRRGGKVDVTYEDFREFVATRPLEIVPTSRFASSIKRITCWTDKSGSSSRTS